AHLAASRIELDAPAAGGQRQREQRDDHGLSHWQLRCVAPHPRTPRLNAACGVVRFTRLNHEGQEGKAKASSALLRVLRGSSCCWQPSALSPQPYLTALPSASTAWTAPMPRSRTGFSIFGRSPTTTQVSASGRTTSFAAACTAASVCASMRPLSDCT